MAECHIVQPNVDTDAMSHLVILQEVYRLKTVERLDLLKGIFYWFPVKIANRHPNREK